MRTLAAGLRDRSRREWGVRALLAVIVATIGYVAVSYSFAAALPDDAIEWAHQLAPSDARITAMLSRQRLEKLAAAPQATGHEALARKFADPEALAQQALSSDATAIPAITTLGQIAQLNGDSTRARRLFAYSERLSRRDLTTQLWLIEDAVGRGRVDEALRHYDIALRTNWSARNVLFPVLASASSDPAVAPKLEALLSRQPAWADAFISFVGSNGSNPAATANLFTALNKDGVLLPADAQVSVVDALMADRQYDAAWQYYARVRSGADRNRSRDPNFAVMPGAASRLDWIAKSNTMGLSANIQRGDRRGSLIFSAPSSIGGVVARQMQLLPPGRYILEGSSSSIDQPARSEPYWKLICLDDQRELGRVEVPSSSQNGGRFSGLLAVPADCPAQNLQLVLRASDALGGVEGQIDRVELKPAS